MKTIFVLVPDRRQMKESVRDFISICEKENIEVVRKFQDRIQTKNCYIHFFISETSSKYSTWGQQCDMAYDFSLKDQLYLMRRSTETKEEKSMSLIEYVSSIERGDES